MEFSLREKVSVLLSLKLVNEMTFKDEREFIVYSDGKSNEFKNQFITGRLLIIKWGLLGFSGPKTF